MDGWKRVTQQMAFEEENKKYIYIYKKASLVRLGRKRHQFLFLLFFFHLYFSPASSLLFFKTGIQKKYFFSPSIIV